MPTNPDDDRTILQPVNGTSSLNAKATLFESNNSLAIGTKLGEFEITGLIGEGGFGIVYLALDHSLGRTVALKEYMPSALAARSESVTVSVKSERHTETFQAGLRSFVNEARLLAQFDHPSLVKVYRFWEANGTAYMVMPYYKGMTLKQSLKQLPTAPDEKWLKELLAPLLDALESIHREQCFHRDIAPDNILLLPEGRPLLLDFGAARRVVGDMTQALTVILKPGYAPIEQYADVQHMKQGAWTDIYALGAVVYFAIMGKTPPPAVGRMIKDDLVPLASAAVGRYSDEFLRGIDRALAVKPADRPQNIAELRDLLHIDSSIATSSYDKTQFQVQPARNTRRLSPIMLAGLVVTGLVLAGTGLYVMFIQSPEIVQQTAPATQPVTTAPLSLPPEAEAVPIPKKPFNPVDALDQMFDGRDRTHSVTVELDLATVKIGKDRLRFRLYSSRSGYLYVFLVGTERDRFNLLFPNALDAKNRVESGKPMYLPRPGWTLEAAGPPGINHFLAVVSDSPRDFSSAGLKKVDPFAEFPLDTAAELVRTNTSDAVPFLGKVACASSATECSESFGAATFTIEETR